MPTALAGDHRANRLLASLEHADFSYLEPHLKVVELARGKVLYEAGESIRWTYFPHNMVASLVNVMAEGSTVEVSSFGRESVFGFLSAVVSGQAFGRYVVKIPGLASQIEADRMREALDLRPAIRRLLLRYSEALLAQTFQTVSCNTVHPVEARCCCWILGTRDRVDADALPITHEFLAEMMGVQRSTVSGALRSLQVAGLIRQHRGGIQVVDRPGLEAASCECYGKVRQVYARLLPNSFDP